jgi:phosphate-selective porin OprO and OprP
VRAGQYKIPFGLQMLSPDWGQQLVDRSIATLAFGSDRDTGAMLLGTSKTKKLGYSLGAFNGSGESRRQNNAALLWAVRVWADPLGEYKLPEGAVEAPEKSVLHFGLALHGGDAVKGGRPGVFEDPDHQLGVGVELAWKRKRAFLTSEYFWQRDEPRNPTPGPDVDASGWHVQGGYMVLARRLELAGRYAAVDPNRDVADDRYAELRGGANYYWRGHNVKLQADLARLTFERNAPARGPRLPSATGKDLADIQLRLQLQLYF